ncbi:BspA family leucine-rich repeat surface protein, partial [Enterococcus faecium]|uniref:BspA family leucine-rich repeat surface protein n=1 Tax=Enterococcus faecium TaxID=1352 RepID=UPI0002A3366E
SYMFNNCRALTTLTGLDSWDVSIVTDMSYMFNYCEKLSTLDLKGWNPLATADVTQMFCYTNALKFLRLDNFTNPTNFGEYLFYKSSQGKMTIVTNNQQLLNSYYDFKRDKAIPIVDITFNPNGGTFSGGSSEPKKYLTSPVISVADYEGGKLTVKGLENFKTDNSPIRAGWTFVQWNAAPEVPSPSSLEDYNNVTFTANWVSVGGSPSTDNTVPDEIGTFGIAYYPTAFDFENKRVSEGMELERFGLKNKMTQDYHIGVKDFRGNGSGWNLYATARWDKESMKRAGAKILLGHQGNDVYCNTNNGKDPFESGQLTGCPRNIATGANNPYLLPDEPKLIMGGKVGKTHQAVYDYELDYVQLNIPNPYSVASGSHTGSITWTLSDAPVGE